MACVRGGICGEETWSVGVGPVGASPLERQFLVGKAGLRSSDGNLPAMRETQVRSLGQEDPLEKEMAIHSSTLAWRIPWTEEAGGLQSTESQRVGHD